MSNYDLQLLQAQRGFLRYDLDGIAARFHLNTDDAYLYLPFLGRLHRISRISALVEVQENGIWQSAGFHTGMTFFDLLTNPEGIPVLSGQWCAHASLNSVCGGTLKGELSLSPEIAAPFAGRCARLRQVCELLGAMPAEKGDYACILPLFPWFSVLLRFYEADEDFPAQLMLLWDKYTTRYLRYETTFYTARAVLDRLQTLLSQEKDKKSEEEIV